MRNPDHLAAELLPPAFWVFGPFTRDHASTRVFIRAFRMRDYHLANAMTRHVDGILENAVARGVTQVVLVGAGFDSRAYRFGRGFGRGLGEETPGVRFFEVDQPATMRVKKARVQAVLGRLPGHVTYLPFDYRSRPLFDALQRAGLDPRRETLFIWEGTTVLTEPAVVDATLRSVARRSRAGSEMVFDYVDDAVVRGDFHRYPGARYEVIRSDVKGEPWVFGIAEGESTAFVTARGLGVVSDLGATELAGRYLSRSDGTLDGQPTPWWRVLHAVVPE